MQNTVKIRGMDVSVWQGKIDWEAVARSGIRFAMVRAGIGMDADENFEQNVKGAEKMGIDCGAYHYSKATSAQEAIAEADFFLNTVKGYRFAYPVALDIENITQTQANEADVSRVVRAFCDRVQSAGYYVSIYCDLYWIDNLISPEIFNDFDLWLAEWTSNPTYAGGFGMWQYTGDGNVLGINSNVDLDVAYKDYPAIMRENGLNGFEKEAETDYFLYTIRQGDTLWQLARRFGTTYERIAEFNGILPPYILNIGEVVRIPQTSAVPTAVVPENVDNRYFEYTVTDGDSLWNIGKRFGVDYMDIAKLNGLSRPDELSVGQVLRIPETEGGNAGMPGQNFETYTVTDGDTLWDIGKRFGVDYMDIAKLNGLSRPDELSVGQMLRIPETEGGNAGMPGQNFQTYTVRSGDTLWDIGRRFGVDFRELASLNNISDPDDLKVAQILRIPVPAEKNEFRVGDRVQIMPNAEFYYSDRRIPESVKNDYTYYVDAVEYNGQPVTFGGKPSVLLGRRRSNATGRTEGGFNTWVNTDILKKVNN